MPGSGPNDLNPKPFYARGADLSLVPKADETPPADLKKLLGVDSANPFLRALRIERGFLKAAALPSELTQQTPLDAGALAKLREGEK